MRSLLCAFFTLNFQFELYRVLLDALECRAHTENIHTGKLIILPSSFEGSPHNMQQNCQDAMAIVCKFGKPDLFLTFTCNPSWSEILNCMEGVQYPEDRPDIIIRVFNMKLKELLEDICKHGIFGTVLAYIYVIEFQKRGLPHAHILLTLDSENKIRTKDDIDKFVSAELPDPCTDLRLFQIVTKCIVHGPMWNYLSIYITQRARKFAASLILTSYCVVIANLTRQT
ncbi:hypothetical protein AVEN_54027-1 [Araneus ventricosus]|uniref:Helitron helicase-like domain-containing protein n=1 Tax=Araneus ventricosus TaxID=182803 RepID=A0A4Y2NC05_ARAVE|nr:hypothetical protein AVEN_54027-1 [Araneus ventricosus]